MGRDAPKLTNKVKGERGNGDQVDRERDGKMDGEGVEEAKEMGAGR